MEDIKNKIAGALNAMKEKLEENRNNNFNALIRNIDNVTGDITNGEWDRVNIRSLLIDLIFSLPPLLKNNNNSKESLPIIAKFFKTIIAIKKEDYPEAKWGISIDLLKDAAASLLAENMNSLVDTGTRSVGSVHELDNLMLSVLEKDPDGKIFFNKLSDSALAMLTYSTIRYSAGKSVEQKSSFFPANDTHNAKIEALKSFANTVSNCKDEEGVWDYEQLKIEFVNIEKHIPIKYFSPFFADLMSTYNGTNLLGDLLSATNDPFSDTRYRDKQQKVINTMLANMDNKDLERAIGNLAGNNETVGLNLRNALFTTQYTVGQISQIQFLKSFIQAKERDIKSKGLKTWGTSAGIIGTAIFAAIESLWIAELLVHYNDVLAQLMTMATPEAMTEWLSNSLMQFSQNITKDQAQLVADALAGVPAALGVAAIVSVLAGGGIALASTLIELKNNEALIRSNDALSGIDQPLIKAVDEIVKRNLEIGEKLTLGVR